MANNYYGFTHAGTQYGTAYTPVASVATASYPIPAQMYGTTNRTGYDQTYPQTTQSASGTTFSYTNRAQPTTGTVGFAPDSGQYQSSGQATTYPYGSAAAGYTNTYNSVVTNYAATALYSQQTTVPGTEDQTSSAIYSNNKSSNWNFKKQMKGNKPKTTKSVQQLHYCEVCKISCAGPQTYKEHLEGQRHKKKEAQLKSGGAPAKKHGPSMGGVSLRCELCDVTCTGNDAYAAHIRGAKHQKVVKLHTKLGKPIPSTDPTVIAANSSKTSVKPTGVVTPGVSATASTSKIKVLGTPRINFVGGGRLHTTGSAEFKEDSTAENVTAAGQQSKPEFSVAETVSLLDIEKSDAQPVGQDYIDEIKGDDQKVVSFYCKLCDCRFNDPNAKEMHLKGRRHRLQYKKKVDPNLVVDVKPSLKHRKLTDMKERRYFKRDVQYWNDWYGPNTNRYYDSRPLGPPMPPMPPPPHMAPVPPPGFAPSFMGSIPPPYRRGSNSNSWDDIHIMQKHSEICPKEEELDEVHHLVSCVERALKLVSDKISEEDTANAMNDIIKREFEDMSSLDNTTTSTANDQNKSLQKDGESKSDESAHRQMKGLMRVGPLAEGLLLTGDKEFDLVVICAEKPTKQLLQRIVDLLPSPLQVVSSSESFDIVMKVHESGLSISSKSEPIITANVSLTSPLVREENVTDGSAQPEVLEMAKEPKQLLDRQKCVDSLAALRHAKWFQARVANLQPAPMVIRLFRDLCKRLPTWSKLSLWAVELLTEKVISSAGEPLAPGEALRHSFEAIASGILLPGGNGLLDPCEKEPTDALASLTRQEREDITASAQHALRLIAFRQIYKILGVDPLPNKSRKRRYDSENGSAMETESVEVKKEKTETNTPSDGLPSNNGN